MYVLCFEPIKWHAFVRNPKGVKILPEEPNGKICNSGPYINLGLYQNVFEIEFSMEIYMRQNHFLTFCIFRNSCIALAVKKLKETRGKHRNLEVI